MISRQDIQRLLHHPGEGRPILSVFLDMTVDSNNKRTGYGPFLAKERTQHRELASDREMHHVEAIGEAFDRVQRWIDESFDEANKGVAIYAEVGGEWLDAVQFPIPVKDRTVIAPYPLVAPLAQLLGHGHRHGVIVVDRERLLMYVLDLGVPVAEHEVKTEGYPTPHDVRAGGEAAKDFQKRKAQEVRHFFKEFANEVAEFDRRYRPADLIILGTEDNVTNFVKFLSPNVMEKVVHTDRAPVVPTSAAVVQRLTPFFTDQIRREELHTVDLLRDRVAQRHLAVSGFGETLERLQEGKVDSLVVARDLERAGGHCLRCGFYLAQPDSGCNYCGGPIQHDVDLFEAMIRMAEEQEIPVTFVDPGAVSDLDGAGGILKF